MPTEKIAFLFLTYIEPHKSDLWERYLNNHPERASVYMHPKFPGKQQSSYFRSKIIKRHAQTKWGSLGLVKAVLYLIDEALKDHNNKYFVLLSDSCIPLYSFNELYQKIVSQPLSIITCKQCTGKDLLIESDNVKRIHFKKQSQWMILTRSDAEFFYKNDHTAQFARVHIPDEKYFVTLMTAYGRKYKPIMPTFVLWKRQILSEKLSTTLRSQLPIAKPRMIKNSVAERQFMARSKRFFGTRNLNNAHPITFTNVSLAVIKTARDNGCLFLRKVSKDTNLNLPFTV